MSINSVQPSTPKHTAAKVAGAVITTAAAAGTVLYLAKTGKLNATEGGNVYLEKAKAALKTPADIANEKIEQALTSLKNNDAIARKMVKAQTFVKNTVKKVKADPKFINAKKVASAKLHKAGDFIASATNKALASLDTAKDFVESKLHPEKFL